MLPQAERKRLLERTLLAEYKHIQTEQLPDEYEQHYEGEIGGPDTMNSGGSEYSIIYHLGQIL